MTTNNLPRSLMDELVKPLEADQQRYNENWEAARKKAGLGIPSTSLTLVNENQLTDNGKAYRENIGRADNSKNALIRSDQPALSQVDRILEQVRRLRIPKRQPALSYDDARLIVDEQYAVMLENFNRKTFWTPDQERVLERVLRYFIGDPESDIHQSRGLFLWGDVGPGKTYLMRIMMQLCELVPIQDMKFYGIRTKLVMLKISNDKSLNIIEDLGKGNLLLDDLGDEDELEKLWGKDQDPMNHLLSIRAEHYVSRYLKTHYTSNKSPSKLEKLYGTRLFDRICEQVEFIKFPGETKRHNRPRKPVINEPV